MPPDGERILWQGSPSWRVLARRLFQVPLIALYFGLLAVWAAANAAFVDARSIGGVLESALLLVVMGAVLCLVLSLMATWIARTTVYTITSERVAIRFGLALEMTVNLPFKVVQSAELKTHGDGSGNIPLVLLPGHTVYWLMLWPHVRPWHWRKTQPMLRGLPQVSEPAESLARALADHAAREGAAAAPSSGSGPSGHGAQADGGHDAAHASAAAPAPVQG